MIAGGYTQDDTIFVNWMREGVDVAQNTVPILAYYPADDASNAQVFQVYIWPT